MGSIEETLETAGAEDDLQTILQVLEDSPVSFKRHEAAAGPCANMDTAMLTGLNLTMLSAIQKAQQQQQHCQGRPFSTYIFCKPPCSASLPRCGADVILIVVAYASHCAQSTAAHATTFLPRCTKCNGFYMAGLLYQ